jgi:hypothetical protein
LTGLFLDTNLRSVPRMQFIGKPKYVVAPRSRSFSIDRAAVFLPVAPAVPG